MEAAMPTTLSQQQLSTLENALKQLIPAGAAPLPATAGAALSIETQFCSIWPQADPIIKLVAKYVAYIPGVGSAASGILTGLDEAGNALAGIVCPKT
jgi:hypothetical protein